MLESLKQTWEGLFLSITTILRMLFLSRFNTRFERSTAHDACVILGNGPSLNTFLKDHEDFLADKSIACVNYFVRSKEDFVRLKPEHYIIVSPEYWRGEEKEGWHEDRLKTFALIAELTTWKLTLFVPMLARKYEEWKSIIHQNKNITINYFNNTPLEGFRPLRHFGYKTRLGMPRPHNVLVGALFVGISLNYEKLFIAGAEHSWLKELHVTQDNRVMLSQKHFYEDKSNHVKSVFSDGTSRPMYKGGSKKERRLHEVLEKFYFTFRSYWELNDYAEEKGIKIYNLTQDSYIDAFDRYVL